MRSKRGFYCSNLFVNALSTKYTIHIEQLRTKFVKPLPVSPILILFLSPNECVHEVRCSEELV